VATGGIPTLRKGSVQQVAYPFGAPTGGKAEPSPVGWYAECRTMLLGSVEYVNMSVPDFAAVLRRTYHWGLIRYQCCQYRRPWGGAAGAEPTTSQAPGDEGASYQTPRTACSGNSLPIAEVRPRLDKVQPRTGATLDIGTGQLARELVRRLPACEVVGDDHARGDGRQLWERASALSLQSYSRRSTYHQSNAESSHFLRPPNPPWATPSLSTGGTRTWDYLL
jgi:hypothetical protein